MPKGIPGSGTPKGLALAKRATIVEGGKVGTTKTGLEDSEEIKRLIAEDEKTIQELDTKVSADEMVEEAFETIGEQAEPKIHPIGNGTTVPYPWDGEPTTDVSTCYPHKKDENRGCAYAPICPMVTDGRLHRKYNAEGGPYNVVYKDLRSGLVKTAHCPAFIKNYLHQPHIVILPGIEKVPTRGADYKPLPNGQQPTPGPNQPRTPIVLTPRWTRIVCVAPEGMMKEFQQMRRSGDFLMPKKKRARGAA